MKPRKTLQSRDALLRDVRALRLRIGVLEAHLASAGRVNERLGALSRIRQRDLDAARAELERAKSARSLVIEQLEAEVSRLRAEAVEVAPLRDSLDSALALVRDLTDERDRLAEKVLRLELAENAERRARRRDIAQLADILSRCATDTERSRIL